MNDLTGRVALVTGGAVRVGRILALRLASLGADVALLARESPESAAEVAAEIESMGAVATVVRGDLLDARTPERVLGEAVAALGRVDILVNNAAVFEQGDFGDLDLDEWSRMQRINLRAPMLLSQVFAAALPSDREGDIVKLCIPISRPSR